MNNQTFYEGSAILDELENAVLASSVVIGFLIGIGVYLVVIDEPFPALTACFMTIYHGLATIQLFKTKNKFQKLSGIR